MRGGCDFSASWDSEYIVSIMKCRHIFLTVEIKKNIAAFPKN
jgi:hypothetical protein